MKYLLSAITLCMALSMQPALAAIDNNCELILGGAEKAFADIFPTGPVTQVVGSWCFRVYLLEDITRITGVNSLKTDDFNVGVYVVGPRFGEAPAYIGTSTQVLALIGGLTGGSGNKQDAICDDSNIKDSGIKIIENGKKITVTTEGKCVKLPKSNNSCDLPPETDGAGKPIATGINMLTETELISFEIKGLEIPSIPGFSNPLDTVVDSFVKDTCFKHVRKESVGFETKTDICFDISELVQAFGAKGPVTMTMKANSKSSLVDDCANTNADTIIDLVKGHVQ